MANNNAENVAFGKPKAGGAAFAAPIGTVVPVDAQTPLTEEYKNFGYATEDGLTNTVEKETETVKDWAGEEVATSTTSRNEQLEITPMETNAIVLQEVYGEENVTVNDSDGGIAVLHNAKDLPEKVYVFEIVLDTQRVLRKVVPRGKVISVDTITYKSGEPISYKMTIKALPDADGNTVYDYIAKIVEETEGTGA